MAKYRRELTKKEQKNVHFRYNDHLNSDGGIFKPDKRRKLLGIKPKTEKNFEDTADFWYDVRTTMRNGLQDLTLFAEVSHSEQIKAIFESKIPNEVFDKMKETSNEELKYLTEKTNPTLDNVLRFILNSSEGDKTEKKPWNKKQLEDQPDAWKYYLVREIIRVCFEFLKLNRYVTSKSHDRLVDEVLDMVDSESKNTMIPLFWRRSYGPIL